VKTAVRLTPVGCTQQVEARLLSDVQQLTVAQRVARPLD